MSVQQGPRAYLLVAHGSRDVRSHMGLTQLADHFRQQLTAAGKGGSVTTATLEFGPPLAHQIQTLGAALVEARIPELCIIPLFLLPGNHVSVDLPAAIATAQAHLPPMLTLTCQPHLGAHPDMPALIRSRMAAVHQPWILMAHGSRYPGGSQAITQLATQLGATAAFWSVEPTLERTVEALICQGHKKLGIFSYFLFTGSITDAILAKVNALRLRFNQNELVLIPALDPVSALANLLMTYA